jgi:hypothetical protein
MRTDFLLYEIICNCLVIDEGVVLKNFPSVWDFGINVPVFCIAASHVRVRAAGITNWQWNACLQLEIPIQIGAEWEAINCK